MRTIKYPVMALLLLVPWLLGALLPTCYHTYAEVSDELTALHNQYPEITKMISIGNSQLDNMPIYAFRISDNAATDENEPALLFTGQVHAEEVMGVEICMSNINEILANRNQSPYRQWIEQLDMWFIPTLNPEGHEVVTSNLDVTYRKNKRDINNNGIFDYTTSTGYDLDGVDINRNFDFNWCHGDSLWQPGGWEVYDYYRGPGEFSESETRALKALSDQYKFVYAICWHESRTGNFSEKVYYPFNWKEARPSPDLSLAASIGMGVGGQIINEAGTTTYEVYPNLSRRGAFHDWMYKEYGTMALLIECCTSTIQPDSLVMVDTVNRCSNGVRWMINRATMFSAAVPSTAMLVCNVKDAVTNNPMEAEIIVEQHKAPWFTPRKSFAATGKYYRAMQTGQYTIRARQKGYYDTVLTGINVLNSVWTNVAVNMQPQEAATYSSGVFSGNTPLSARVIIGSVEPDTLFVNGNFVFSGYAGEYSIEIYADGYYPYLGTLTLGAGANSGRFELSPETTIFRETWESGTAAWEMNGPWTRQNELSASGYAITDSWGGWGFYEMGCDWWIKTLQPIAIPSAGNPLLIFDSHLYTEWDWDPCSVEVSPDGATWTALWTKSGRWDWWRTEFVPLSAYAGQSIYLRFRLTDQSIHADLTDPGWTIDNIRIITGAATGNEDQIEVITPVSALYPNFPNPFNPETTISFSLSKVSTVRLDIYNLKGQVVKTLVNGELTRGDHKLVWNGKDNNGRDVASGVYLYKLQTEGYSRTLKMMMMK